MENITLIPTLKLLNELFDFLNEKLFDNTLSKIVITLAPAKSKTAFSWCSREKVWEDGEKERYYEMNVCPEILNRPLENIAAILLHEMCHLHNAISGIQDCSRSGQYHNKHFKECAEKYGLIVTSDKKNGFSETTLTPSTLELVKSFELGKFDLFRNPEIETEKDGESKKAKKPSSAKKYECPKCNLSVRATKEVKIICGGCNELLVRAEPKIE